jgi:D-lactate dehydrogenase
LRILDSVEYALESVVPNLPPKRRVGSVTLHPVCSTVKAGIVASLKEVAEGFAHEVRIPTSAGCCGFAGDRGFRVPQLTAAATAEEAVEVRENPSDGYYSTSPTCEIGLSRATGKVYRSIWHLLEQATR